MVDPPRPTRPAAPHACMLPTSSARLADRILMSVILVRDEVEHSRFKLKPLSMVAADIDATVLSVEEQVWLRTV
eukprot:365734-Chlamydomonas_euryale.AAC.1